MNEPSKERIAAALALAEAVDRQEKRGGMPLDMSIDVVNAYAAYSATAPKLRTRSEVDVAIVETVRDNLSGGPYHSTTVCSQLVRLCAEPVTDDAPEPMCTVHGNVEHGREAEELRSGIEELIREGDQVSVTQLQRLLDEVDARDSLAFSERAAEFTEARARIAELERNQVTPAMVAEFESGKQQRDELRQLADSAKALNATLSTECARFAQQLVEARDRVAELEHEAVDLRADIAHLSSRLRYVNPCERRHLTEAEDALCAHFVHLDQRGWGMPFERDYRLGDAAALANAVCDERQQPAATKAFEPSGASIFAEDDHDPERCSCEEAERLREAGKLALAFLNDCSFEPEGEAHIAREALRKALS